MTKIERKINERATRLLAVIQRREIRRKREREKTDAKFNALNLERK